jgi:hypothetical protein
MTSSTPIPDAIEQPDNTNIKTIHAISTPSLSGSCDLETQLGISKDGNLYLRINSSTGNGLYSRQWLSLDQAWSCLSDWEHGTITALSLFPLWEFRSINTAGYILKILIELGLLTPSREKPHHWDLASEEQYRATVVDLKKKHQSPPHSSSRKGKVNAAA